MSKTYTATEIDEQLAEAKRCKTFVDILNGDTPCVGVTSQFVDGCLNVGLSTAVRLGEIVEQQRREERLQNSLIEQLRNDHELCKSTCFKLARVADARMKKSRKTVVVANRERARKRRKEARANGMCTVLCGRPATPDLNYAGKSFTTCAQCREEMLAARRQRKHDDGGN